ncbi:hypothetical protein WICANDRAFT_31482 [Wickerhamomyces anomalus NRRL Y-366-8]|uniref:glutaminase n=1 Tax=Wickerhamomyces anomalus (strain ATCC 58044 / CBS 1984 / NCYC 433 / NRRL Y-366-8) TaxID=683960 RepID=A0A1E3P222_WICAA|nr:uncharacterized protein WICANDRAFT_31482 [Wickerhamomyces anomalus NRRL Y-366-8]ODQ59511.1 hypothetical protein WICANDRAFT_31482 [Wickerhamomyces anomalus NRRL Y-366-8]
MTQNYPILNLARIILFIKDMRNQKKYTVGVLALQGAFKEHIHLLNQATNNYDSYEISYIEVRNQQQLSTCDALIVPGGESTSMSLIAERSGMLEPLANYALLKKPIWGTCAGLIFLSKQVINGSPGQKLIGALDIQVKRNAFGRQLDSFEQNLDFTSFIPGVNDFPSIFIRAPVVSKILKTSSSDEIITMKETIKKVNESPVKILYQLDNGLIVAVRQGNILGTSFHPELSDDCRFHKWFIDEFVLQI